MARRSRIPRYLAFVLVLVASIGTNAKAAEGQVQLNWQLAPTDKVGNQKSGAACFPNGTLHWRELAKPDPQLQDSRLRTLLEVSAVGEISASGDLLALKAMVCLPWLGIGAKPKSEIKLSIRWTLSSGDLQPIVRTADATVKRKTFDLRADADLLLEAVEASLQQALLPER